MNILHYVDTFSTGVDHEMYNASSLKMFSILYDKVYYYADLSSMQNVYRLLEGEKLNNVVYKRIFVTNNNTRLNRLLKQIFAIYNNCRSIVLASFKNEIVLINYNTMVSIYPINWFSKLFNVKTIVVCHGELTDLAIERKTSFVFKLSKTFFTKKSGISENLYLAVLGDVFRNNISVYVSNEILNKIIYFDHSAIFSKVTSRNRNEYGKLKIGTIGIFRNSKGLDDFLKFASYINEKKIEIELHAIGRIRKDINEFQRLKIIVYNEFTTGFVSRSRMYELISQIDLVLFLLPKDTYMFTASGTLFDAINCEKPIIGIRNDYFDYIESKYGKFGLLFNDFEELLHVISNQNINELLSEIDYNILSYKLSPENISQRLRVNLLKMKFLENNISK